MNVVIEHTLVSSAPKASAKITMVKRSDDMFTDLLDMWEQYSAEKKVKKKEGE